MSCEGRVSGYVLKLARRSLRLTQQRLAEDLGVGVATVQGWESGRRSLLAIPAGNFLALTNRLRRLGADPVLLDGLTMALQADLFLGQALATPHAHADPAEHLLGSWVITRPFTGLVAWTISGRPPDDLPLPSSARERGPVPDGPVLGADERAHVLAHIRAAAERADRHSTSGLLLARQAYYLIGFDGRSDTSTWLVDRYRADRRIVRPGKGWSPAWPLVRSTASALTRLGDPEPMRAFIADQLDDDAGEIANLNYWAFWTGDLAVQQTGDAFIGSTPLSAWHGDRLLRHLLDRLNGDLGFVELNIHTLHALIRIRPELLNDWSLAAELNGKIGALLDENLVSASAERELEALRYGIAMQARH
ncbi:helix-turn-helix domain-containing protein [Rhizohabitans arisaemae]|uniref:helix-turn-helix domain-containing protein n=1 Tax=Rhizohabitans arisaemae TaxID=2720610 RepID=UPI0024B21561|nr:helix-turn-helix domain-containing protein [Rhizohabitans arisaemae]